MHPRWAAAGLLLAASSAAAGALSATHGGDVTDVARRVEVELDGRVVRVREALRLETADTRPDEAALDIDLRSGARRWRCARAAAVTGG